MITDCEPTCILSFSTPNDGHDRLAVLGGNMRQRLPQVVPVLVLGFFLCLSSPSSLAQQATPKRPSAPRNLYDPRLEELRIASVAWSNREGKPRQVVDAVCLVPDLATFLEVVGTWDADHYFPVLIDDATYALKFVRAFRPSKVIRYPKRVIQTSPDAIWETAVSAVGRSWSRAGEAKAPRGDQKPANRGLSTPGVVVTSAFSPSFAGAVALAAGRFQPLLRWEPNRQFGDRLKEDEASQLILELETKISELFPKHARLGDECDFVTLAADYPYEFEVTSPPVTGRFSFDDRLGFVPRSNQRWAYTGRLMGDPVTSAYRAMCSLFLQPDSALLIDTYEPNGDFMLYGMTTARRTLTSHMRVSAFSGVEAGIDGWRHVFRPENRAGLLLINSSGIPEKFNVRGGIGGLGDIPDGVPSIVHMIHSHSADNPKNSKTIAARWLEGGVFLYFGAMEEPYLTSFRSATLIADLMVEGIPLSAAFRQSPMEDFGNPWRLVLLGDPLYRVLPKDGCPKRSPWQTIRDWPAYTTQPRQGGSVGEETRLAWALKNAFVIALKGVSEDPSETDELLRVDRQRLPAERRHLLDDLLADALPRSRRSAVIRGRLESTPPRELSTAARRVLEHPTSL
jgi:hypothetical protein